MAHAATPRSIGRLAVLLVSLSALALATGCLTEDSVREEFDAANHCETAEECVVIYPDCPLGCWTVVNASEEDRIRDLVESFHDQQTGERCMYDCPAHSEPTCDNGACVVEAE